MPEDYQNFLGERRWKGESHGGLPVFAEAPLAAGARHVLVPETINSDRRFLLALYTVSTSAKLPAADRNEHW